MSQRARISTSNTQPGVERLGQDRLEPVGHQERLGSALGVVDGQVQDEADGGGRHPAQVVRAALCGGCRDPAGERGSRAPSPARAAGGGGR